jgi:hypothetical protein
MEDITVEQRELNKEIRKHDKLVPLYSTSQTLTAAKDLLLGYRNNWEDTTRECDNGA